MNLLKRTSEAIVWSQIGRFIEAGLFLGFSVLLARVLGPDGYGTYATGISAAGLGVFITVLGTGPEAMGKFLPEIALHGGRHRVRKLLLKLLALRGGAILGLSIVFGVVCGIFFRRSTVAFFSGTAAFVLFAFATRSGYEMAIGFFGALLELRRVVVARLLAGALAPILFWMVPAVGRTASWGLFASAAGYLVGCIVLLWPWLFRGPAEVPASTENPSSMRRIVEFGLFAWGVSFCVFVLTENSGILLLRWLSTDAISAGYYAVGARLTFRIAAAVMGWAPLIATAAVSHAKLQNGNEGVAVMIEGQWKLGVLSIVGPLAFLFCFAQLTVHLLFSGSYGPSVAVVHILSAFLIASALCGFTAHVGILYVLDHERIAAAVFGGAAVLSVAGEIFLIRQMGMLGAAWAAGGSYLILTIATALASSFFVPLRIPWRFSLKMLGAGLVAALSAILVPPTTPVRFICASVVWTVLFLAALVLLKPLDEADVGRLCQLNLRLGTLAATFLATKCATANAGGEQKATLPNASCPPGRVAER